MFILRHILPLALAAGVIAGTAAPAEAGSPCKQGPPAWWNAPRVTYMHNGQRTRSYDTAPPTRRASSHGYASHSYSNRGSSSRVYSRSYSRQHYAHRRGYDSWR